MPEEPESGLGIKKQQTFSRKATIIEQPKKPLLSYLFATLACFSFGTGNYLNADLSIRLPPLQGVFAQVPGYIGVWIIFHVYKFIEYKCNKKNKGKPYLSKKNSMYYEEFEVDGEEEEVPAGNKNDDESMDSFDRELQEADKKAGAEVKKQPKVIVMFSGLRLSVPIIRALAQGTIIVLIINTFAYAFPSGVNAGIISSIFATSCIFTVIIFFCKYGQKVTKFDGLGVTLILLCVALVGVGGASGSGDDKNTDKSEEELLEISRK